MKTLVFVLLMCSGILMLISILLMSPKGGLGLGIGGVSAGDNYGSQKTVENSLKKTATISALVFVLLSIIYPYI